MHEILVKVGDNSNPDPEKDKGSYKDGDIIFITKPSHSKRVWDQMLEKGRCTKTQYKEAQIAKGVFKWPWTATEKRTNKVVVLSDALTEKEIATFCSLDVLAKGKDENGDPIFIRRRRRKYKIDWPKLKYVKKAKQTSFSASDKKQFRSQNKVMEPLFDKPISKSQIVRKK